MVLQNGYVTGSLFGPEWKQVQEWPPAGPSRLQGETEETELVDDDDEYEEVEEEIYVTLDLGPNADPLTLGTATEYQLIGLDTPTPFLKIGNDVFRGTPQRLIGSEIITKDTRDLLNPIKHSHPPIGYTSHRIEFEPVKLTAHPTDAPQPKERPPMFARDVIPTAKPAPKAKAKAKAPVVPSSPPPEHASSPIPAPAKPSKRPPAKNAVRSNPLSSNFEIPLHGEITADGIPRIDGEKVARKKRKPREKASAVAADAPEQAASPVGSHGGLMQIDEPELSTLQTFASSPIAGPSTLPTTSDPPAMAGPSSLPTIDPPNDTETQRQRVLIPDAPRGYTKRGLPRRKPGPAKGHRKASTIAKEVGGVVSMLTGKLPEDETLESPPADGDAMEVDPESQEPEVEQGNLDPAIL